MQNKREISEPNNTKEMLAALSGAALVVVGAGLLLSHPTIRRYASQVRLSTLLSAALPGIERFMRKQVPVA